jgi:hypothetical protein
MRSRKIWVASEIGITAYLMIAHALANPVAKPAAAV